MKFKQGGSTEDAVATLVHLVLWIKTHNTRGREGLGLNVQGFITTCIE